MKFPREILEKILSKCDGRTVKTVKTVSPEFNQIINYLSQKTSLWRWCCQEEIPDKELIDYLEKYNSLDKSRWQKIYDNWISWQFLVDNITCDIIYSPVEIPRISCIAVSGKFIAVGSEDGRVRIFTENWKLLYVARHKAVKVINISFIHNGDIQENCDLCLVIAYSRALIIDHFDGKSNKQILLEDIKDHSVYKNYICYEKVRGRISIVKLIIKGGEKKLVEIWFSRIYSPSYPVCLNIWNGICTLLINNEVQIIRYDSNDTPPVAGLERFTKLKSSLNQVTEKSFQILRDDIIISLCKADYFAKEEFIEFFILGSKNDYSKKLFNAWEVLHSFITCIFVYGNTLVLGVDCGNVYFYHVSCWKNFDIRNYQKKLIIGKHPIISIDVKECENERKFYITSTFCIHEVVGYDKTI